MGLDPGQGSFQQNFPVDLASLGVPLKLFLLIALSKMHKIDLLQQRSDSMSSPDTLTQLCRKHHRARVRAPTFTLSAVLTPHKS